MKKLIAVLLLACILVSHCGCDYTDGTVQLSNGETYGYFQHESPCNCDLHGLRFETATLGQIMVYLEPCEDATDSNHRISTARDAAYYGATALDGHIKNWTMVNTVGVGYNPTANLWLVHGQFYDRNTPGEAWAVVLEAETGKVLGFTSLLPSEE